MTKSACLYGALLVSISIFLAGCSIQHARISDNQYSAPGVSSIGESGSESTPSATASEESRLLANDENRSASEPAPINGQGALAVTGAGNSSEGHGPQYVDQASYSGPVSKATVAEPTSEETPGESPQILIDTALRYYEKSQEFWMQGVLDKAMETLDQANELILKVEADNNPELIQQKDNLRLLISRRILELYASRYTAVNGNHNAIPLTMNKHVEREIKSFLGREKQFFMESYKRSGRYREMMVSALKDAGMPEELSWLPLIESGFKVNAFSRARALGLWQFIPSTGYKFGLARDTWIDERLDPEKSTEAAIAYMGELHKIFGDWTTVLAAYNCGEGSVLRVIRRQRINYLDNFWDLYERLPRETARYVPRFLAVLHILKDPEKYEITLPEPDSPTPYETATISKPVRLKDVAGKLSMPYKKLTGMNPELRQRATPDKEYSLKVPSGSAEVLVASIDQIPKWSPPRRAYTYHRVRKGQTLSYLAVKYRTSVSAIARANNISSRSIIRVGQKLKIPTGRWVPRGYASYDLLPGGKYRVRRGDSLWLIAKKFNIDVRALKQKNNLKSNTLSVGQVLKITDTDTSAKIPGRSASKRRYRVKKGDSLWLIAEKFRTDTGTIKRLNNLRSNTVYVGQMLKVK